MAVHFETYHGALLRRVTVICPYCLHLSEIVAPAPRHLICPNCDRVFPSKVGLAIAKLGFDISYFGWFYNIVDREEERDAKKQGRPPSKFRLVEPTEVLQTVALWLACGIVGNLGYDLIKAGARRLYDRYKTKRLSRQELDSQVFTPEEAVRRFAQIYKMTEHFMHGGGARDRHSVQQTPFRARYRILIDIDRTYGITRNLVGNRVSRRTKIPTAKGEWTLDKPLPFLGASVSGESRPRKPRRKPGKLTKR
jgi:hypothetical protein